MKSGAGDGGLKLARLPLYVARPCAPFLDSWIETRSSPDSLAATFAALPSISEIPFPRFLIRTIRVDPWFCEACIIFLIFVPSAVDSGLP
jgi:hypothetical protein